MIWKISRRLTENIELPVKFEYIVPGIFLHKPSNRKILTIKGFGKEPKLVEIMVKCFIHLPFEYSQFDS